MRAICTREDELLDALARGFVGEELTVHAEACASCGELRLVAGALLDERHEAIAEAPVPTAATMLWRMQMRHRREAEAAARRSLLLGQAMTLLVAFILIGALFGVTVVVDIRETLTSLHWTTPVLYALVLALLGTPIAGWVVARQK